MPTKDEWARVHHGLMAKLRLPCKLRFSSYVPVAHHVSSVLSCYVEINPKADFRVPEHLILHEAAHHRHIYESVGCACYTLHCEHWARVLCGMYEETGVALPRTTGFEAFAKAAGIVHKVFDGDEGRQMKAIAENAGLVEGE